MKKFLIKTFVRTNIYSPLLTFFSAFIVQNFLFDHSPDRMRNCYMPLFTEFLLAMLALFISLTSITVFLNLNKVIYQNSVTNFLTFFLFPIVASITVIAILQEDFGDKRSILFFSALNIPVWYFLISNYIKFKNLKNGENI